MTLADWIITISLTVTDAAGFPALHPIPLAGAEAIAKKCATASIPAKCAVVYVVMAFLESNYMLTAAGDCIDHLTGKFYPGPCKDGDKPCSFGPFQTGQKPKDWDDAVAIFTPLLIRSATICKDPLAMVASGSCTNKGGIAISRSRMAKANSIIDSYIQIMGPSWLHPKKSINELDIFVPN